MKQIMLMLLLGCGIAAAQQIIINIPPPHLTDCDARRGNPGFGYNDCMHRNQRKLKRWQEQVEITQALGVTITHFPDAARSSSQKTAFPSSQPDFTEKRHLYPADDGGTMFRDNAGNLFILKGNKAYNLYTDEIVIIE